MSEERVILVEDDPELRAAITQTLELAGLTVSAFDAAAPALAVVDADFTGVVVTDIRLPDFDGLTLFARIQALDAEIPVILMTGHGDVAMAVGALQRGAADFLAKPFASDHLVAAVTRSLGQRRLVLDNRRLRADAAAAAASGELMLGDSDAMRRLRATIAQLAALDVDVLIEGETGSGKELAALLIHRASARAARPFVAVDCAALPEALADEILFGRAGAGAEGRVAAARRGTLLLDDLDATTPANQARLLRLIEDRELLPLGAERPQPIDVRVIATVSADPDLAVAEGRLRADLRYRLGVVRVRIPPLRERRDDIAPLFAAFVAEAERETARQLTVTAPIRAYLARHAWPGNVRELRGFARSCVLGLHTADAETGRGATLAELLAAFEHDVLVDTLVATSGDVEAARARLGLPRKTFYERLSRRGIKPKAFR